MATIICPKCSTRNPTKALACRRCGAELQDTGPTSVGTLAGNPTAAVLGDRWVMEGLAPGEGAGARYGTDMQTHERVVLRPMPGLAGPILFDAIEALTQLRHPNIEPVLAAVQEPDQVLQVTRHQEGRRLDKILAEVKRLPVGVALFFATQLFAALKQAHQQRLPHGRVEPGNLLVLRPQQGTPLRMMLCRFIEGRLEAVPGVNHDAPVRDTLVGRPTGGGSGITITAYMAPECLDGEITARGDLYSAGVVFYQMLTGQLPLGTNAIQPAVLRRQITQQASRPIRQLRPELSVELESLLSRLLSKNPQERPQDAGEILQAMRSTPEARYERMVAIPAGPFLRGSMPDAPNARREEQPVQGVELSAYFIDQSPVTVRQYVHFLEVTGRQPSEGWQQYNDVERGGDHPVVFINWQQAREYAHWAGKRLPTEAEWEKAARGSDGRRFPWGDEEPSVERCNFDNNHSGPTSVFAHPAGSSPYGLHDMAGNVFEWVQDWYARDYYQFAPQSDPPGPGEGSKRVLKGGSFVHKSFALRCATRGRYDPEALRANHSFRCAWSIKL